MKKYLVMLATAVAALTMASCSKEEAVKDTAKASTTVTLKASLNGTKTVTNPDDPTKTEWESSDALSVFVGTYGEEEVSVNYKFNAADAAKGIFSGNVEETFYLDMYDWYLLYPYNANIDKPASTTKYILLGRGTQTQAAVNDYSHALAGENAPLVGHIITEADYFEESAQMHHITSVVKFNIKNTEDEPVNIETIKFETPGVDITGQYYVDFSDAENVKYTAKSANKNVILNVTDGTLAAGETASFYVVTRPFEVAANSVNTISITANTGMIQKTWTPATATAVEAGDIQAFNIDYVAPVSTPFETINANREEGTYFNRSATVVAAGGSYAVAYDGTDYMILYNSQIGGATKLPAVGNAYSVSGSVTNYYGLMEWNKPVLDLIGASQASHKTLEKYNEQALAAYAATASATNPVVDIHYVELEGTVASGKMTVGDNVINLTSATTLVDGTGTVTGYLYGYNTSKKTFSVLVTETDIQEAAAQGITLEAPYTLKFPKNTSNTAYANIYTVTLDGIKWIVPGNQSLDAGLKLGGKFSDDKRSFYSQTPIANNFKTVTVKNGVKDTQITVNAMTLTVYKSASDAINGTNAIATLEGEYVDDGTTTFTKSGSESWANCYYKLTYDMHSTSPSSNKGVIFVNAVFAE